MVVLGSQVKYKVWLYCMGFCIEIFVIIVINVIKWI